MISPPAFLGLTYNPFSKQGASTKDCFQSRDFKEMTGALGHLVKARGIGVHFLPGMARPSSSAPSRRA